MSQSSNRDALSSPDPVAVRAEVTRLVAVPELSNSPQLVAMLRYVVETTLDDRQDRLKGYVIGTEVFGRPENFDPQTDPIVRVQAKRLRDILERHYQSLGQHRGAIIRLQKGSYAPIFESANSGGVLVGSHAKVQWSVVGRVAMLVGLVLASIIAAWLTLGTGASRQDITASVPAPVLVRSIPTHGDPKLIHRAMLHRPIVRLDLRAVSSDGEGLLDQLVTAGNRFDIIRLLSPLNSGGNDAGVLPGTHIYEVQVAPCQKCSTPSWSVVITSMTHNEVIHVQNFERAEHSGVDLGARIMKTALSMDGPIFVHLRQNEQGVNEAFACANATFSYFQSHSVELRNKIRKCLERYNEARVEDAIMEHIQALMYVDAHWRNEPAYGTVDQGVLRARRAVELAPFSSRTHYVLSLALGAKGEFVEALRVAERAYELNPLDDLVTVGLAVRMMGASEFERARTILDRAWKESPIPPAWLIFNLATINVMLGEVDQLLPLVPSLRSNPVPLAQMLWVIAECQREPVGNIADVLTQAGFDGPDASEKARRAIAAYYPNPAIQRQLGAAFAKAQSRGGVAAP